MPEYTSNQIALARSIDALEAELARLERLHRELAAPVIRGRVGAAEQDLKQAIGWLHGAYDALPETRRQQHRRPDEEAG